MSHIMGPVPTPPQASNQKIGATFLFLVLCILIAWTTSYISKKEKVFFDPNVNVERTIVRQAQVPEWQEFRLNTKNPIPTVSAGPGTRHEIEADDNFYVFAVRPDNGKWIRYTMPEGRSSLNGVEPSGRILLQAINGPLTVRIRKIR